jgi:RNA polymerase-binding transcription factor DksA
MKIMGQHDKLRAALAERLKSLSERNSEIEQSLSSHQSPDWEERAQEMEDDDVLLQIGTMSEAEASEIKLAIARIDSGQYGKCTDCGSVIPKARLEAIPFATRCISCAGS